MIRKVSLFSVFERALKNDPEGSRKNQFRSFVDEVKANPALIEALAEEYFDRMFAQWKLRQDGRSTTLAGTSAKQERAARQQEVTEKVTATVNRVVDKIKKIIMLDLVMPNGKKLRECTGAELARFGGFYTELSRHLKPTQIVDKHLNEADIQSVYSRFTKRARSTTPTEMRA